MFSVILKEKSYIRLHDNHSQRFSYEICLVNDRAEEFILAKEETGTYRSKSDTYKKINERLEEYLKFSFDEKEKQKFKFVKYKERKVPEHYVWDEVE